jgi:hypothetical protein
VKRSGQALAVCLLALACVPACDDGPSSADAAVLDGAPPHDGNLVDRFPDQPLVDTSVDQVGGPDAGPARSDGPGASSDLPGGACNDLAVPPLITATVVNGRRPASEVETGGTLLDGEYTLTKLTVYKYSSLPSGLDAFGMNMRLRNGIVDTALVASGAGGMDQERLSERLTVVGNKITTTPLCPADGVLEESLFTTNGAMLRMSQDDPALGLELVVELVKR